MILMLVVLLIYPLWRLTEIALGPPSGLGNVTGYFEISSNVRVLRITFVDSALVTLISVSIGAVIAWSLRTTQRASTRTLLWVALLLPFLMGTVNKLYAIGIVLQTKGIINEALLEVGIIGEPLKLLYTQLAVIIGMVYQMLPFAVVPIYASYRMINLDMVAAAESLGASRPRAIMSTVIPLAMPSILASAAIVFMISVGFLLTPVLLGGATSPFSASLISQSLFTFYNIQAAALSSLILLVAALITLGVAYVVVGRDRLRRTIEA